MLSKSLIKTIFGAAYMQRWNDHIRPMDFSELDKQAHKMIIAYALGRSAEDSDTSIDWDLLIKGGIFEFLQRVKLTDIKPSVFHAMMASKGAELCDWVSRELKEDLSDILSGQLHDEFDSYFKDGNAAGIEQKILKAAHYMATNWEFRIIYNTCPFIYGIEETKKRIEKELKEHASLIGVKAFSQGGESFGFIDLCGQLRFQKRWSQTSRTPETSVLGHLLVVGMLSYLVTLDFGWCSKRRYNNFFSGLFHDLPEVLTRDIVSPVKRSVPGLEALVKEYEETLMNERLLPLLPKSWHDEVRYFTEDEFDDRIQVGGKKKCLKSRGIGEQYDSDGYNPIDGSIIEIMDKLSAFVEASLSIEHGIKSETLLAARQELDEQFNNYTLHGVNWGRYFKYFGKGGQ